MKKKSLGKNLKVVQLPFKKKYFCFFTALKVAKPMQTKARKANLVSKNKTVNVN